MNIFKRIFKIGEAEAHSAIDKLEDPIKVTEQGIRDLKKDLDKSLHALAEVKAMSIRSRNEKASHASKVKSYESKAMLLLKKGQDGSIDPAEADRLASEALLKKKDAADSLRRVASDQEKFDGSVSKLDSNVKTLRSRISKYENELKTLKARVKVASATKKLNKQLSQIDSGGTVAMLERMKEKVEQEEALAESYGEIAGEIGSIDDEIDKVLEDAPAAEAADELAAMKERLGM